MGEIYCGILAVVLILGAGLARGLLWVREIRLFPIALGVVLLYALGWYTPVFRLMYDVLPGVDLFRRPADATFILGLLIAVLAGYLLHRVLSGTAPPARWYYSIACALISGLTVPAIAPPSNVDNLTPSVLPLP